MNLAVRVIIVTALLLKCNLFTLASRQDSLRSLVRDSKNEEAKAMLYLQLSDEKGSDRLEALREAEGIFKSSKNNSLGIEVYLKLGEYFTSTGQYDSASVNFEKALYLSELFNDQFYIARSNQEISRFEMVQGEITQAKESALNAKRIFTTLKDTFWLLQQVNLLAEIELAQGNPQKAKQFFNQVIRQALLPRDKQSYANAGSSLGEILIQENNYFEAFECFRKSKQIWEDENDSENLARTLNNLGAVYLSAGLDSLAYATLNKSLGLINNNIINAQSFIHLSTYFLNNGNTDEALSTVNTAIEKSNTPGSRFLYTTGIIKKAEILCHGGKYMESQALMEGALKIIDEQGFQRLKPRALANYAEILYDMGMYEEANRTTIDALEEANQSNDLELIEQNYSRLGRIMNDNGQYISASRFLLLSNQYKDSLSISKNDTKLKNAVLQYELSGKGGNSGTDGAKKTKRATIFNRQEANSRLQNMLFISIALLVVLILFFSVLVFKGYRSSKKLYEGMKRVRGNENSNDELEKLAVLNNKIFSVISHDLRSPIISIKDSIEFLRQEELDDETKKEALAMSEELAEATLNLLDNLLGWAKNQKKKVDPKKAPVKLLNEIKQIEYLYKASLNKKEINLKIDCNENVVALADNEMVNLSLRNLVSNAIKFTPRGGSINITGETFNNAVLVSVKDSGIGISREDQHKILTPDIFFTKNGTENESGSGIGLKLVNEFIKLMGGELKIESSPDQGSNFMFSLPAFEIKKNPETHKSIYTHKITN